MEEKELGLVVKIIDYDDRDQIVTIMTDSETLAFIALGVRKLQSKNRIALQLGNIIEVELFRARLKGKVSKLKRASMVKQLPIEALDTALVWMEILKHISNSDVSNIKFFRSVLESYPDWGTQFNQHIRTYILFHYLSTRGLYPTRDKCIDCQRTDGINGFEFYKGGFTCNLHTKKKRSLEYLKGVYSLFDSYKEYKKTSSFENQNIYKELVAFLQES